MNIDSDCKIDDLTLVKYLKEIDSPFLPNIKNVYQQVFDIINNRIQQIFPTYTLHNTGHSFRIIEYMCKIVDDYRKLNQLEITLLIYSALLHDIGMAVSSEDIEAIKNNSFQFCDVKFSAMLKTMDGDENLALQEYIRRIHSSLSKRYIEENLRDKLVIPQLPLLDFTHELALICESHTKDYDWIKRYLTKNEVRGDYSFNSQFIASILRLADILDIDSNRTPYHLYNLIAPEGKSDEEWQQHFVVANNEKIILDDKTKQKKIVFHGKTSNASIHRKILTYISWIKDELSNATILVNGWQEQYKLFFDQNPEVHIQTEGYTFSDYKMTLEFRAISSLLMGEKIYGDNSLGLRELIQNSIDSCKIRYETEETTKEFGEESYKPIIKVIVDKRNNTVIVKDNGTGMSMDIIKKHFLNIGVSYYNSNEFLLKDFEYRPIGNFGIGFLSCFMLSDKVRVLTRHYKSKNKYLIELERGNEWTSLTESEDIEFNGTEVILDYTHFMNVFENETKKIKDFLKKYFLTDRVDITLVDKDSESIDRIVNSGIFSDKLEKGYFKIDLSDFLFEMEGYVIIKQKNNFIFTLEDLDFEGDLYSYDDENGLQEVDDLTKLNIADYLVDSQLEYIAIPLVDKYLESDFLSGLEYTGGDVSEVLEKYDNDLNWISVIVPLTSQIYIDEHIIQPNENVFDDLGFENIVNLGHSKSCATKRYTRNITLFEGVKNSLYLPFEQRDMLWNRLFYREKKERELFIRNVLINNFDFDLSISASIFEIKTIVVNINSRQFIPDISRNNIDKDSQKTLNYLIGKVIHKGARQLLNLNEKEKSTLDNFINTFYQEKFEFEK